MSARLHGVGSTRLGGWAVRNPGISARERGSAAKISPTRSAVRTRRYQLECALNSSAVSRLTGAASSLRSGTGGVLVGVSHRIRTETGAADYPIFGTPAYRARFRHVTGAAVGSGDLCSGMFRPGMGVKLEASKVPALRASICLDSRSGPRCSYGSRGLLHFWGCALLLGQGYKVRLILNRVKQRAVVVGNGAPVGRGHQVGKPEQPLARRRGL